jgi:hypothetical protein
MNKKNFNTIWLVLIGICLIAVLVAVVACVLPGQSSSSSTAACGVGSVLFGSPFTVNQMLSALF